MWSNTVRTTLRALRRRLGTTIINVAGLAIGLACCLLVGLYIRHHLQYDRHHANADRIVRMASVFNERAPVAVTPNILGPTMETQFPEVEETVRTYHVPDQIVRQGNRTTTEDDVYFADPAVFDVFTLPFVAGTETGALDEPQTLVLTASAAGQYFGTPAQAIEQTLSVGGTDYTVTGVIEDPPSTSHWRYRMLLSGTGLRWFQEDTYRWSMANYATYALLTSAEAAAPLQAKIDALVEERMGERMRQSGFSLAYVAQPLTDIHLYVEGNITYVYLFGAIALLILIVAGINFVNLATARSTERAREVGVRKTLGAARGALVRQFLTEAVALSLCAAVLAYALSEAALPAFEQLARADLAAYIALEPGALGLLLAGAMVTGLLAGLYPAFALSRFQPARVLKGSFRATPEGQWLRHGLVVGQFAASIVLIAGTLVVFNQLDYVQSKNLGFQREHVVTLPLLGALDDDFDTFRQELTAVAGVRHVAPISSLPGESHGGYSIEEVGREGDDRSFQGLVTGLITGPGIVDALGLTLIAGEPMPGPGYDVEARGVPFLVNETIVRGIGWTPEEAVGQPMNLNGRVGEIRGVVADFHVASLRSSIDPVALFMQSTNAGLDHAVVRLDGARVSDAMDGIEGVWREMSGGIPFAYEFLDDRYDDLYRAEQRTGRVLGVIAGLAIFIACLGLLGLAAYTTQRRLKEISIRKVLGATVPQILMLLSRTILWLVGIAFLLAVPLALYGAQAWLGQFAYATSVGGTPFLIAGTLTLVLAVGATVLQSISAARSHPAEILQQE